MRNRHSIASVFLAALLTLFVPARQSHAVLGVGDLVFDPSVVAEQVRSYRQELITYAQQLKQTFITNNQYLQMLRDYNQVLIEYRHYLNELAGLASYFSEDQWIALMSQVGFYGSSDYALLTSLDPKSPRFNDDLGTILGQYRTVPQKTDKFMANAASRVKWQNPDELQKTYNPVYKNHQLFEDQIQQIATNKRDADTRKEFIHDLDKDLISLPEGNTFGALELIARQNQAALLQTEEQLLVANQLLGLQNLQYHQQVSERAQDLDREIHRLERAQATSAPLLGKNSLGAF
jgi:hypothetical protein